MEQEMQLFAGLDMHADFITGTIKDENGNPVRVLKVETTKDGVKKLFERLSRKNISAVFEASRNWPYYADLLKPYCSNLKMAHPLKVRATARKMLTTIWHLLNKNEYYAHREYGAKYGL